MAEHSTELDRLRRQLDEIDRAVLTAAARRVAVVRDIAAAKAGGGDRPLFDRERERAVYERARAVAAEVGLPEAQVRVIAPFIGGGFGPKIMMFYPEEVLIPWLAMKHGRPMKWIEDRQESFLSLALWSV